MSSVEEEKIIQLIKSEVVRAVGCTEPAAVALCVAKAVETLGETPQKINVLLSANILKNAMGVGIPNTGMVGLPIAVAMGALVGRSEYGLEVLKDVNPDAVRKGQQMIENKAINIALKPDISDVLYIEVECLANNNSAVAIIRNSHTNFVYLTKNQQVIIDNNQHDSTLSDKSSTTIPELNFRLVYDFAMQTDIDKLRFILESVETDMIALRESKRFIYGHSVAQSVGGTVGKKIFGSSILTRALEHTTAVCDVRMGGANVAVMSNSGSGNQGITATMPVYSFAIDNHNSEESLVRALILSNLLVIYIKQSLGRLSALCGCVVASTGATCGVTYLMGGSYEQITFAAKNMMSTLAGMICDGAKPSCSLKISSGVATAMLSAVMAIENKSVTAIEGIIDNDIDRSILNLTEIGKDAMLETDRKVLDIMVNK
ncbi:MAG: L-serine ammonia-lyase, iron-sulfur-dependent, subunit alpha [Paludibacter sp.]|jgi:L-cysteine desulfidase|nr:L-serine ammonia-lyase, iron-sulfur-dependent, subunit alpha [Paludibacter sp.]